MSYVSAHVELWIIEYFFLKELFFGLVVHIFFKEMERSISLLGFYGASHSLLFLEDGVEIFIISIVTTALYIAHDVFCDSKMFKYDSLNEVFRDD